MRTPDARQRGFTLSETLMTLGVAAIAFGLAGPSLTALVRSNGQATSVNQLVSTMHLARSTAITQNALVSVCASRDGDSCAGEWHDGWIAFVDSDADQARDDGERLLDRIPALAGIELDSAQFARAFSYRANGRAAGDGLTGGTGEFSFCAPGETSAARVVVLGANGLPALTTEGRDGSPVACSGG
jgi:type IV fimbrial biogenesis protein FimT